MDWPKIKTILIIVLIATNIMLGYTYNKEKIRFQVEKEDNLQDVITLYESKGVDVGPKAFAFTDEMKSVNIFFDTYDITQVDQLLGTEYYFDGVKYTSENRFVLLTDSSLLFGVDSHYGRIILDGASALRLSKTMTDDTKKNDLIDRAKRFIEESGFKVDDMDVDVLELGKYSLVRLSQSYESYVFEESKTMVWFYNDEIVGFKRENIVNISEPAGVKYDIISLDKVLYGLLPKLNQGDRIEQVSLIYKLNDESLLVADLVSGEALPYYRIVLKSGEEYHVRAVVSM